MNDFIDALTAEEKSCLIPDDKDYFGQFIGTWEFDSEYFTGDSEMHTAHGEWIFSWILEGRGIQDVFIWPPRSERDKHIADGEYAITLRLYNPDTEKWDIAFINTGYTLRFSADKVGENIVLTEKSEGKMQHIFSDISEDHFIWRSVMNAGDGTEKVMSRYDVRRVR